MITKYPNRRLYSTERRGFITLQEFTEQIGAGNAPTVRHRKDGTDATTEVYMGVISSLVKQNRIDAATLLVLIRKTLANGVA
jgi:polyhydroxyalkanoate synthesis regulator protein